MVIENGEKLIENVEVLIEYGYVEERSNHGKLALGVLKYVGTCIGEKNTVVGEKIGKKSERIIAKKSYHDTLWYRKEILDKYRRKHKQTSMYEKEYEQDKLTDKPENKTIWLIKIINLQTNTEPSITNWKKNLPHS